MRFEEIDDQAEAIADKVRLDLENRFLRVRLRRCERNIPISRKWVASWGEYINKATEAAVEKYQSEKFRNRDSK